MTHTTRRRLGAAALGLPLVLAGALLWPSVYSRLVEVIQPIPGPVLVLSLACGVGLLLWVQAQLDRGDRS